MKDGRLLVEVREAASDLAHVRDEPAERRIGLARADPHEARASLVRKSAEHLEAHVEARDRRERRSQCIDQFADAFFRDISEERQRDVQFGWRFESGAQAGALQRGSDGSRSFGAFRRRG